MAIIPIAIVTGQPASGVLVGPLPQRDLKSTQDPFKRLVVEGAYHIAESDSVKVSWCMEPSFAGVMPLRFTLYRGRAVNDSNWERIAEVVDQPWLYDRRPVRRPHERSTFYKVEVVDADGIQYWSHPVSWDVSWNHYDWRLCREIIRKEQLLQGIRNGSAQQRGGGTKGYLLKRRQFGEGCTRCLDQNTGVPTDSHCPICYGTGVVGGYYDALEYWVIQQPTHRVTRLSEQGDTRTTVIEMVRSLAHPAPEAKDVWVQSGNDVRYEVQSDIDKIARHRGVDIVLGLRLLELPTTNAVYQVPLAHA
jgi:hypothetical protein